jgi:hypothetical protein
MVESITTLELFAQFQATLCVPHDTPCRRHGHIALTPVDGSASPVWRCGEKTESEKSCWYTQKHKHWLSYTRFRVHNYIVYVDARCAWCKKKLIVDIEIIDPGKRRHKMIKWNIAQPKCKEISYLCWHDCVVWFFLQGIAMLSIPFPNETSSAI